ncbi:two-component regulator propeller domain-containing protein [Bacteroides pyogenes]|uniref:hybrid sensor histidine kinase/response regulator transcription factor n=1 Tax=Bacteroides pyogenes TaxID=310300 RepID=UPI003A523849
MKRYFLFLLLLWSLVSRVGSTLRSDMFSCYQLSSTRGLSSDRVFSLCRDDWGRMWIATKSGVDCYDGTRIHNYRLFGTGVIEDDMGHKINFCKTASGSVTAYTNAGKIFRFDPYFNRFQLLIDLGKLLNRPIYLNCLTMEGEQTYACTSEGVYKISAGWKHISLVHHVRCTDIAIDSSYIYIATDKGLCQLLKVGGGIKRWIFSGVNVTTIFLDRQTGFIWVGTKNQGVLLYDCGKGQRVAASELGMLPNKTYRSISPYDSKILLLGVDGEGVYAVRRNGTAAWKLLSTEGTAGTHLKSNDIYDVMSDGNGNIWVGKYTEGVTVCNLLRSHYQTMQHESGNKQSLVNNHVNAILEDEQGNLWFATDDGISIRFSIGTWRHLYPGKVFLTLCKGNHNNVWAGSYGFGLWQIDTSGRLLTQLTTSNSGLTTNQIYYVYKDRFDNLWIGGHKGALVRLSPKKEVCSYPIDFIHHITAVDDRTLVFATANGFYTIDMQSNKLRKYFDYPKRYGVRSNSYINFIFPMGKSLWLATDGGGLVHLNLQTKQAKVYTTVDGLPSNYVFTVAVDRRNRVWVSTDHGLAYMQHDKNTAAKFASLSTLNEQVTSYKPAAFVQLADSRFIYGSDHGTIAFNPVDFGNYYYRAPLQIYGFSVTHPSGENDSLRDAEVNRMLLRDKNIRLAYNENIFTVSFTSVSFQYQNDILYTYHMENFDNNWSLPSYATDARYTNLPPGDYVFHVRSMSRNTGKQISEARLMIHISHPWWNTLWARIAYLLLASLIFYSIWRNYMGKLERENFKNKLQFFVNTAHDIRTPVTLIINPLRDLDKQNSLSPKEQKLLSLALNSARNLYHFTTELLDFQKMDVHTSDGRKMKMGLYDLKAYLTEITESCASLFEEKDIRTRLIVPKEEVRVWMNREKVDHVLYNVISNAVKYNSHGGKIIIKLSQNKHYAIIAVRDTGIGIPQQSQKKLFSLFYRAANVVDSNQSGNGIGLAFAREIMRMHKGDITFSSIEGKGTTFFITFPRKNRHRNLLRLLPSMAAEMPQLSPKDDKTNTLEPSSRTSCYTTSQNESCSRSGRNRKRLMIIEDNDELRFYLQHIFETDYQVINMPDGASALAYLKQNMVDFIISDVMMPGIQGDMLCRKIKTSVATSHIPIILLTAKAGREDAMKGLDSGADDYIPKPFDSEMLKAKVHNRLNSQKQLRKHIVQLYHLKQSTDGTSQAGNTEISPELNEVDRQFLDHCMAYTMENMHQPDFSIASLCREIAMSRTVLYEKLKALTGKSPGDFITIIRMQKAAELLQRGEPIQDVAVKIGLSDANYFSTAFKKHYGVPPSKFKKASSSSVSGGYIHQV